MFEIQKIKNLIKKIKIISLSNTTKENNLTNIKIIILNNFAKKIKNKKNQENILLITKQANKYNKNKKEMWWGSCETY